MCYTTNLKTGDDMWKQILTGACCLSLAFGIFCFWKAFECYNNTVTIEACMTKLVPSGVEKIDIRLKEIYDLKKLREIIKRMNASARFTDSCLKQIDREIEFQEYVYYRELGQLTYENNQKTVKQEN